MFNGSAFNLYNRSMYVEIFLLLWSFSDQIITIKWTQFQNINNTRRVCFKHRVFTLHINLKYCSFILEGRVFEIHHTIWHVTLHIVLNYRTSISVFLSLPWNIVKLNNRSTMYLSKFLFWLSYSTFIYDQFPPALWEKTFIMPYSRPLKV